MPRRRPPGKAPSLHHALFFILVVIPFIAAAQQQQPFSNNRRPAILNANNNAQRRSPPELDATDPSQHQAGRAHISSAYRNGKDTAITPANERAIATFAPAESIAAVRAHPARPSAPSGGLSTRHPARSLQDWQVEDLVLLATVDGKIHARERSSGAARWELEVDRAMVETTYHRHNKSAQDVPGGSESEAGDFLWIVEPSQDGALYVYAPGPRFGMQKLGLTVKQLVEELSPYAGEDPPVVYTAEKKNTLYTVDAGNGNILKMFSSAGSVTNNDRSCRKVNALEAMDEAECEPIGTLTLGRTEYTVAIQDKNTGEPLCTIKYFEWGPNNRDKDLFDQYATTLDDRYVYSKHDGSIMALDHAVSTRKGAQTTLAQMPMYSHKFSSPVARVYDVVRPFEVEGESEDSALVILPQPIGPVGDELPDLDSIFVNTTEGGSWYALSEKSYPLVTDGAPHATCYNDDMYVSPTLDRGNLAKQRAKLIGVHPLSMVPHDGQSIPTISGPEEFKTISSSTERLPGSKDLLPSRRPVTSRPAILQSLAVGIFMVFVFALLSRSHKQWSHKLLKLVIGPGSQQSLHTPPETTDKATAMQSGVATANDEAERAASEDCKVRVPEPAKETIFPLEPVVGDTTPEEVETETEPETVASNLPTAEDSPPLPAAQEDGTPTKPEKKARRGVRGGRQAKQKRLEAEQAQQRRRNNSQDQKKLNGSLEVTKIVDDVKAAQFAANQVITVDASESPTVSGKIQINSLVIDTDRVLGHGSAGTCVFEGSFEGREVAVKRMLSQYYELASQEVSFLQQSDDHENVIRYFCQQKDQHFLYIAVELCQASLWDLYYSDSREEPRRQQLAALLVAIQQDVPRALYQLAAGLQHLHNRRIIHRDIKPQNILIAFPKRFESNKGPRLVISDFGLCKTLPENVSTLIDPTGNAGTCGWKAPELISQPKDSLTGPNGSSQLSQPTTSSSAGPGAPGGVKRAADIFSLGCLFFWVLTGGCHPFDDKEGWMQMRELNIKKNNLQNMHKLDLGSDTEEPMQLITAMLAHRPEDRPAAHDVLSHPFFWKADARLAFLCDVSDHFEREPRDPPSAHLDLLESYSASVIERGDFLRKLDKAFVDTLGKQRKYTGARMLDLLRALRNKKNHYEDMPDEVKRRVGALPAGYLLYWTARFPKLLMACYSAVRACGVEGNDRFRGYFGVEE